MNPDDKLELSLEELSLESMDESPAAPKTQHKLELDTRHIAERRTHGDRRSTIRFQDDRRSGKDRRAGANPWSVGTDH